MKNRRKKAAAAAATIALVSAFAGTSVFGAQAETTESKAEFEDMEDAADLDDDDEDDSGEEITAVITLSDAGSTVTDGTASGAESSAAAGVTVNGDTIEITAGGTYVFSGTLSDGQIYVEVPETDTVTLRLDGVELTNKTEPAIYVEQADKVRIKLVKGSENLIQSGTSMPEEVSESATGGAIFSRDDLVISGSGSLTVNGYIKDGIHGNDDLTIKNGTIDVNAAHHAVKTNETLSVKGGTLSLTSGEDGLHSSGDLTVTDGDLTISAGDDGIHADTDLSIEGGTIEVTRSYEGIEANRIYVTGGDISVTSRDDGFNAYGGQNNFGRGFGMSAAPGSDGETETEDPELIIDDGTIYVNAGGDGLDSNGDLIVNGGYILIDGPESSANGALDSGTENGGVCQINGGTVLAIGASGMAERFGSTSTQASFRLKFDSAGEDTEIRIADADGNELFSYTSAKSFSSLVFSSPEIEVGEDYTVTVGSQEFTFTQDSINYANTSGYGMGGGSSGQGGTGGRSDRPGGSSGTPGRNL